jgi:hypothetical protein
MMVRARRPLARETLVLCLALGAMAGIARAEEPVTLDAKVTYLTSATVYVDAGSEEGVQEGDVLDVVRNGTVIGWLHVFVVSSHKSGCRREDPGLDVVVGDVVRYIPHLDPAKAAAAAAAGAGTAPAAAGSAPDAAASPAPKRSSSGRGALRDWGLAGRIGVRYQIIEQPDTDYRFTQPGLDLRLAGTNLGGSSMGLEVDIRSYRSYRISGPQSAELQTNRVYRANASWTGREVPMRVVVGRMYSPTLSTVSLFDGVLAEYSSPRWSFGGLAGTQPNPVDYGFSSLVRQYGGYATLRGLPGRRSNWGATVGLVGSYIEGEINREFVYLQGYYDTPRFSAYLAQEIDLNRGWKAEAESSFFSPTSIFGNARYRVTPQVTLGAGIDSRRNVLLYRDYIDPLIEFDDAFRQGYWVSAEAALEWLTVGANARFARGGDAGDGESYSLLLGSTRLPVSWLNVGGRATFYDSARAKGQLYSLAVGVAASPSIHFLFDGGLRQETGLLSTVAETQLVWYGVNFDIAFARHWLYLLSFEQTTGGIEDNRQLFTSFSYRF